MHMYTYINIYKYIIHNLCNITHAYYCLNEKGLNKMFAPPEPENILIQFFFFFTTNAKEKDVKISCNWIR